LKSKVCEVSEVPNDWVAMLESPSGEFRESGEFGRVCNMTRYSQYNSIANMEERTWRRNGETAHMRDDRPGTRALYRAHHLLRLVPIANENASDIGGGIQDHLGEV
jgi:hypothetical protein